MKNEKTKKNNRKRLIYAAIAIIILIPAIFYLQSYFNNQGNPKAAIIDQLGSSNLKSLPYPNQTFLDTTKELLYKRFSVIDFYSDNATVEQYKQLASAGYKLIVWRAHSALDNDSKYIAISTTDEEGSINYDQYLENGQLTFCNISAGTPLYFGITPKFIQEVMTGRFQDTVIVLMSCNGLKQGYDKTAQAFESKGAKVLISWDDWISSVDNDDRTSLLLQYLINENDTVGAAVAKVLPSLSTFAYATLRYYPINPETANYHIPDYRQQDNTHRDALMTFALIRKTEEPLDN